MIYLQLLCCALPAITFLQSGIDKVLDYQGNLGWLKGHFAKTFLAPTVPLLLVVVTACELAAGTLCALGGGLLLLDPRNTQIAFWGLFLSGIALLMLFFGQRIAKDYAGAATLVCYFVPVLLGLYFLAEK